MAQGFSSVTESAEAAAPGLRRGWLDAAEQGSVLGIWALVVLTTLFGRRPSRAFLRVLVAYYLAASKEARRSSRAYLERIHGRPVGTRMIYRHLLRFAQCTLDRLYFVRGKVKGFDVQSSGEEHLWELVDSRRGAILLGAHLGSFEAMQSMADARDIRVNIVGYFQNARMINAVLERLNPRARARLIELDPSGVDFVFRIRELVEAGELVSIMCDRVGSDARTVTVDFLGAPAVLPTGPLVLAAALKCPVYLVFGLHRGSHDRYELFCEPFADPIELPRRDRQEALRQVAQRYADRLEHYCRLAPDNWFNFFDFWRPDSEVEGRAP